MPTIDPRPRINLLPLTDAHKEIFAAAVRLVLANPAGLADAVRWLENNYSIEAYRKRFERQWEAGRRWDEHIAQSAPSIEELRGMRNGGPWATPTSWRSKNDEYGIPIRDENGESIHFFDKELDDKRRAEAEKFDPEMFKSAMRERKATLAHIEQERRNGRPVSQVERLRLAMSDLADAEMEIGDEAEAHARKLVFVAYLLVWHETRDDLGDFGRWKFDGSAIRPIAESAEEAKRLSELLPGRDRALFTWFGFDKREVEIRVEAVLNHFADKVEMAVDLFGEPGADEAKGKPEVAAKYLFMDVQPSHGSWQGPIWKVPGQMTDEDLAGLLNRVNSHVGVWAVSIYGCQSARVLIKDSSTETAATQGEWNMWVEAIGVHLAKVYETRDSDTIYGGFVLNTRALIDGITKNMPGYGTATAQDVQMVAAVVPEAPPPALDLYVFRRSGKVWEIRFDGEHGFFNDAKGFQHIHQLLHAPGKDISALVLWGVDTSKVVVSNDGGGAPDEDDGRQKIRERLLAIESRLAEFDPLDETEEPAKTEIANLKSEQAQLLLAWKGGEEPRGKERKNKAQKTPRERAADAVQKNIGNAYALIQSSLPSLVKHLHSHIETGNDCIYKMSDVNWTLS